MCKKAVVVILLMIIVARIADARFINRKIVRRSENSVVSIYDRNCFFSPMGCHFLQGRRAMTFITPSELEAEQRYHLLNRQRKASY